MGTPQSLTVALILAVWTSVAVAARQSWAQPSNLTVDGGVRLQVIDGGGPNINADVWYGGAAGAALDLWTGTGGATLFRVVYEPTDWVSAQSLIAGLYNLDAATLDTVYNQNPRMTDLWGMIGYLNAKGIGGDAIMVNFQGWTAAWIGGSGKQGASSFIGAGHEQDFATMVASLMYYGKVVKGLDFNKISPFNEPDFNCQEGPCVSAAQERTILDLLVATLNHMGLSGVTIAAPSTTVAAYNTYSDPLHADATINLRIPRYDIHMYGTLYTVPPYTSPAASWWLSETGYLCSSCDVGVCETTPGWPWTWSKTTADDVLQGYELGMTGVMFWIGTESIELQEGTPPPENCFPTIRLNTATQVFTPDIGFYALAIPFRAAKPGRAVISATTSLAFTQAPVAFYDPVQGGFALAGHTNGAVTIAGRLSNLPVVASLQLYETDGSGSKNAAQQADVPVSGQAFSVTIPADTLFELEAQGNGPPPPTPTPGCPPAPESCRTAGQSLLLVKNNPDHGRDGLLWKWIMGTPTSQIDFGDPTSTADYSLCIYAGAASALSGQAVIPAGSTNWSAMGTAGYRYVDPSAAADGINKVVLKGSAQNSARVLVRGRGADLPDLPLPATAPVTVQLVNGSNGLCWGSRFTAEQLLRNDGEELKARAL